MNYRVHHQGQDLGTFPLEELRRRRSRGEFTGTEFVWCEGMADWQPLDSVLQSIAPANRASFIPPPHDGAKKPSQSRPNVGLIIAIAALVVIVSIGFISYQIYSGVRHLKTIVSNRASSFNSSGNEGVSAASKPLFWTTNTLTQKQVRQVQKEFRVRQWLDAYRQLGPKNAPRNAEMAQFIEAWIDRNYGGPEHTNLPPTVEWADKFAADPAITDPLVLTVAGVESVEQFEAVRRLDRALKNFQQSNYRAYPQFYATVILASKADKSPRPALDAAALELFRKMLSDGSITPADQEIIAETFINGWGNRFFNSNDAAICDAVRQSGPAFEWLAVVLEGERQISEAWRARGGGYANTVTDAGWKGFYDGIARAHENLSKAWELKPQAPVAAARMITVAMAESDVDEMRVWFDRAIQAQIDYQPAWNHMLYGLYPRWLGSHEAMLALGVAAIESGRFDTDAPRQFFVAVSDIESDDDIALGEHIYGRPDIWPHLKEMYEGYINEPSQKQSQDGWRGTFAVVAYFAGEYEVAAKQLEALNWKPWPNNLKNWGANLSLMPLEVAARAGVLADEVDEAEIAYLEKEFKEALVAFENILKSSKADERTKDFARHRIASLKLEERLESKDWVSFLPESDSDPLWVTDTGKPRRLPDGALEVSCDRCGHMIFSRARFGTNFEVRGEFEVVRTSTRSFQAGLVMGLPDTASSFWYSFRVKRNEDEGDVATFGNQWSAPRLSSNARLDGKKNSFQFSLQGNRVKAIVNGVTVFDEPNKSRLKMPEDFYVGLGAFNDANDTVIRYRNVQIRQLDPP